MPTPRTAGGSTSGDGGGGGGTPRSSMDRDPRVQQNVNGVLTSPGPPTGTTSSYGPGSLGYGYGQREGEGSRRGSEDRDRARSGHSGAGSVNHSPTSVASSSRHVIHGGEPGAGGMMGSRGTQGVANLWPAGGGSTTSKLPRITTSVAEGNGEGPRSAPVSGPLRPPSAGNGPIRSSTSPDPHAAASHSQGGSPIDGRPQHAPGNPFYPAPSLQFPTPQLPVPPRRSSHQNHLHNDIQVASDRHERPLGSQSSHHSLSASNAATETTSSVQAASEAGRDKDMRVGRSRDPTYCGQCNLVVHGQFVRAMGKVYHLNCFRCKVSSLQHIAASQS